MRPTEETIRQALGILVFGTEDDELEDVVVRLLAERRQTVSTVEWGTRGRLARWLARAAAGNGLPCRQSDDRFAGRGRAALRRRRSWLGLAAGGSASLPAGWPSSAAACLLPILPSSIGPFPAIDPAAANAPIAPSDTVAGVADSAAPPSSTFALATAETTLLRSSTMAHHPAIWEPRAAKQALNLLRLHLRP